MGSNVSRTQGESEKLKTNDDDVLKSSIVGEKGPKWQQVHNRNST